MTINFPHTKEGFISHFQEIEPCLMKAAGDVSDISWREINGIIDRCDVSSDDFKLLLDGVCPKDQYVESYLDVGTHRHRLIKPVVYDLLLKGATVIANKIANEEKIRQFSNCVASYTGRRTVSSIYATFGTKESFRAHWDTRDVFAVQLIGKKQWTLFKPTFDSPLHIHQSRDFEATHPCPTEPFLETTLEPGDVLYIPRGWWHQPKPLGGGTCHLAIGTFPPYAIDYLNWALNQMSAFPQTRKSLNGWETDKKNIEAIGLYIAEFIDNEINYNRFLEFCAAYVRIDSPIAINIFGNADNDVLPMDSKIRLASVSQPPYDSEQFFANGIKVSLSEKSRILLSHISNFPGITVNQLAANFADMDCDKLHRLVHELCHQDILELVTP
ncbi:JmjC domain-containing protein [Herbaspirillum sp. alder98]|uniref:JmjC domain-containing protein n=1 Tax=Herbaspirillum sp. alder98 TaxID=2913096 RepID=UPI001CD8727F|nr:cupin domain-containing protein [Herbaspirillum sp. alder98]MCA1324529.1 cupin domain-containing protein [Herbaspirillum sp. alder98]